MTEARTNVSYEAPLLALAYGERQCSEAGSRSFRGCETGNDDLLAFRRLDLQPVICPRPRKVWAIGALGHDAFQAVTVGLRKEFRAEGCAVMAKRDQFVFRQNSLEPLLTLQQGKAA